MRAPCRFNLWALALAPMLAQTPSIPPVSSQLPDKQEQVRARQEVVPPARSSAEMDALTVPRVYEGTLIEVDRPTRSVWVATKKGPQRIRLSQDAAMRVDGKTVNDLSQLPQGHDVRASFKVTQNAESLDLKVIDTANGPQVRPPRDQGSPSISP